MGQVKASLPLSHTERSADWPVVIREAYSSELDCSHRR